MDAEGAIGPIAHFGHAGLVAGNMMCIVIKNTSITLI